MICNHRGCCGVMSLVSNQRDHHRAYKGQESHRAEKERKVTSLPVCPTTRPSEHVKLCICSSCFARPANMHPKTIFGGALSNTSVQAFVRFRMGDHSLPGVTNRAADIARAKRVCTFLQTSNLGDEQHLVFECPALQGVEDRYNCQHVDHVNLCDA